MIFLTESNKSEKTKEAIIGEAGILYHIYSTHSHWVRKNRQR